MPKNNDILTLFSQLTCGDLNGGCFKYGDHVYVHNGHLILKVKAEFFDNLPDGVFYFHRRTIIEGKNPDCLLNDPVTKILSFLAEYRYNKKCTNLGVIAFDKSNTYIDVANNLALLVACNHSEGFINVKYLMIISKIISKLMKNNSLESIIIEPYICYKDRTLHLRSKNDVIEVLVMLMTCY